MFSLLQQSLSIGPLNLPLAFIVLLLSWIIYRIVIKRFYRGRTEMLRTVDGIISNAFFILLIVWKFSPLVFQFKTVISNPLAVLYLPGGVAGAVAGVATAALYSAIAVFRKKERRGTLIRGLFINSAVLFSLVVVITVAVGLIAGTSNRRPGTFTEGSDTTAPDFALMAEDGEEYRLSEYRGSRVVLNFWASWCPPCRAELPELKAFYNESVSGELVFLSINLYSSEQDPGNLPDFIEEEGLPFPVLYDRSGAAAAAYGVRSIPTTVIIDRNGNIDSVKTGAVTNAWLKRAVAE